MASKAASEITTQGLIACNIYISLASKSHSEFLIQLLRDLQYGALKLRTTSAPISVVHAFADTVYNRTSFHLAGNTSHVVDLASSIALKTLISHIECSPSSVDDTHHHPSVGLVDHIAVMPLRPTDTNSSNTCSSVARLIGTALEKHTNVLYYGKAHPEQWSLATVRREQTQFFSRPKSSPSQLQQVTTVGAPVHFVENFNVRLKSTLPTAQSLTRWVRERDGGLVGVEALTLPYSWSCWEVACNLLQPHVTSVEDVWQRVLQWQRQQDVEHVVIERGYRVGTTAAQCLGALSSADEAVRQEHDCRLLEEFRTFLEDP